METLIITFVVMLLVIAATSVGVMFGRSPIKGSCGGVGAALGEKDYTCPICGDDPNKCEKEQEAQQAKQADDTDLAYELPKK
ncbi:(Na+)-NQR maturation NqrM [Motiliproteus sediminis]|uniref:(Na+)-NQR maturation NqrM n=1 Tax=Motiliproteus sediminis TaxID=1468178 RepID=UPI001AEFAE33|nr:(Na+)-NQR maturation NqrM [Motiliproteus sediminis]